MNTFHVTTFGCQMNEHDSERMKGMLESLGYSEAPEREQADLILFNTCSIREKADNRLIGHLGEAKRLRDLEDIARRHAGVDKVYAMQAGREIRVIVKPEDVDDDAAALLSHTIAREVERELEYAGQIKVTVIRESRAVDVAK